VQDRSRRLRQSQGEESGERKNREEALHQRSQSKADRGSAAIGCVLPDLAMEAAGGPE
jgi:hypothetical protein